MEDYHFKVDGDHFRVDKTHFEVDRNQIQMDGDQCSGVTRPPGDFITVSDRGT